MISVVSSELSVANVSRKERYMTTDEPDYEPCQMCGRYTIGEVTFPDETVMVLCSRCEPKNKTRSGRLWVVEKVRNDGVD